MKLLKKITCALLTVFLINASFCTPVLAAEGTDIVELAATVTAVDTRSGLNVQPKSTTFIDTSIDISFSADGMFVAVHTVMNATASVVGVKDIKVQRKGLFGWTTVATVEGGEVYDIGGCVVSFTYTGAEYEEIYRVTCTHYGEVDEYRELYHETEGFTCIY